jgi:hypothetical protein
MDDMATQKLILHALACKVASFFQACFENKYLNSKMKEPLKNLRIYALHVLNKCYPSTLAWPDPISKNGTFKVAGSFKKKG